MRPTARWYHAYGRVLRGLGRMWTRQHDRAELPAATLIDPPTTLPPVQPFVLGKSRTEGDAVYGYDHLDRSRASGRIIASPNQGESGTTIRIYALDKPGTPPATQPHVLCEALNLDIDFSRIGRRDDVLHRPGYLPSAGAYPDYHKGALSGVCVARGDGVALEQFPRDHLRDLFGSFTALAAPDARPPDLVVDHPVLFITREPGEHANLYHAHTDILSAFEALYILGLDPNETQVVLLDNHPAGPFDEIFRYALSRRHRVMRIEDFEGHRVRFRSAAFVPPGYSSFLFAHLWQPVAGTGRVGALVDYGRFFARSFGVACRPASPEAKLKVVLIARRLYRGHVSRGYLRGQITNEAEVLAALAAVPGIAVEVVDFAQLTFPRQLEVAAAAEILIGLHGAGLAHMLCMREYGAVIEIVSNADQESNFMFPHMGTWSGREVRRSSARESYGFFGTFVRVDASQLHSTVEDLAAQVRLRRASVPD